MIRLHLADLVGYSASMSTETLKGKVEAPVEDIIKLAVKQTVRCRTDLFHALFNIFLALQSF